MNASKKASNFQAQDNEANFGPPIRDELVGGAHITFECLTRQGEQFFMTRWPNGLPRHDDRSNVLRFPHGLIKFGETLEQCATRLVKQQLGMKATAVRVVDIDSYVDDADHWHIEPLCIVDVTGRPCVPEQAGEIISFTLKRLPRMTYWSHRDFLAVVREYLPDLL